MAADKPPAIVENSPDEGTGELMIFRGVVGRALSF
jgi:hypothetical protein